MVAILRAGLDKVPLEPEQQELPVVEHENVRGGDYYDTNRGHDDRAEEERTR